MDKTPTVGSPKWHKNIARKLRDQAKKIDDKEEKESLETKAELHELISLNMKDN